MKVALVPALKAGKDMLATFLKLNATVAMSLRPSEDLIQVTGVHVVQIGWLKGKQQWTTKMSTNTMGQVRH